jgi:hypothetical protein
VGRAERFAAWCMERLLQSDADEDEEWNMASGLCLGAGAVRPGSEISEAQGELKKWGLFI